MDELSIQRGGSTGVVPQDHNGGNATAAPGGFAVSFTDLLRQAGAPVGIGIDALTDLAGNTTDPGSAEPPAPAGDDGYDHFDDAGAGRGDDRPDAGPDTADADYGDDQVADQGTARTDDPGDPPSHGDETPRESEYEAGSADPEGDSGATEAPNPNDGTTAGTPAANGGDAASSAGTEHAGQVLAGVAAAQASKLPGNAAEPAGGRPGQGLSTATAAVAKETPAQGGNAGRPQTNAQGQQPQATPGARAPANTAATPNNGAAAQAAALSKTVGEGNPVSVRVAVTNDAATLVSQPGSNLAASTVLSGTAGNQPQNGQSLHGAAGTNPAATNLAGGAGQGQQATIQAAQVQAAAGTEVTGSPVLANAATLQPQAGTGGTIAPVGAAAVGETPLTQQPAASTTANAQRAAGPRPGVADQVSVHIAKALKAGVDRITIQLKPASLGRIDVQLEVGHDGRVMAVVTADNKDTLDLLQRDARELERALQDAGLQADSGSLSFNLRGQGGQAPGDGPTGSGAPNDETAAAGADDVGAPAADYGDGIITEGRIDIRA
ncbi:MAG: flagellar hook-length control protein FliK [Rhodospirillales bacterium]